MTEFDDKKIRPDLERALSQAGVEEVDLEDKRETITEYSEKYSSDESDRRRSEHNNLAQVASHATSIGTTGTELTGATSAPQLPEKKPWYHKIDPLRWGPVPPLPKERTVSKEFRANFFSVLTFHWINPLMTTGYRRPIELDDIYLVNPERSSENMSRKLNASFKRRAARNEKSPLMWAIYDTLKFEFLLGGTCAFFSAMLQVFSPFALRYLIAYATEAYIAQKSGQPSPSIGRGLGLVFGITFMQICQSTAANHFIYRGMTVGGQSRAVLINAIFEKSLTISGRAKAGGKAVEDGGVINDKTNGVGEQTEKQTRPGLTRLLSNALHPKTGPKITPDVGKGIAGDGTGWNNGKIINLMSVDTHRVDTASGMFHILWTSPVQIVAVLIVLCVNIGYSALAGYALIAVCMPLLTKAIKMLFVRRKRINKVTDQRVTLTQEILGAVRFVKFFGWESSFLDRLKEIRKKEIRMVQVLLSIRNAINAVSMSMPIFASMLAFIVYSVTGHDVSSASRIFSSLALFNSLRLPLNLLPLVIGQATDASASLSRIQEFLLSEEQTDEVDWQEEGDDAVKVVDATFTWERSATQDDTHGIPPNKMQRKMMEKKAKAEAKEARANAKKLKLTTELSGPSDSDDASSETTAVEPFRINNIDFTVGRNELLAVIGTVGCGKTSLLAALAGDMRKTAGKVQMVGTRAFCPQYAWIQNATLKENVTFGKPFKSKWYDEVIDACALRPDLAILPAGDLTEIGERGITLSGGQKQRLNIARAIYFDADIVLMDDPLSAVDAHVGRHIMDHAICGLMKDKCRILATHQLHVLSRCDRILWLDEGHIRAIDTFENLMSGSSDFQKLMATTAQENDMEKKEGPVANPEDNKTDDRAKTKKKAAALMQQEERAVKSVSWSVWGAYFKASGRWWLWPLTATALVSSQGANIATSLWLSFWVGRKFHLSTGAYIGVYAALGVLQCLLMFTFSTLLSTNGTNSSKVLLQQAIAHVLRAPISFFDTTPLGRITNRFSKDVDSMDNNLTDSMRMYFLTCATIISVFALVIAYYHYFAAALGPLILIFLFASSYYRASAREMKRHEAVLRSVVFARFSETVSGVASIRAYGLQKYFTQRIRDAVDDMDSAYFLTFANQRWLAVRLDTIGNVLVFITGILVVTNNFNISPATSGLVLSYILSIVQMIQFTVRQLAEVENNMNATERLYHYGSKLEQEAPLKGLPVSESWPSSGAITFDKVDMRYRPELPLVLQGLTFSIRGGERIGIVGRTGAGKSSIMSALFRLTELSSGQISIDGIDIAQVGLQDLRSRLAIIPQDPTLFRGTVRSNLDPFNEHSDLELWDALRKADLVGVEDEHTHIDEKAATTETLVSAPRTPTQPARITLDTPVEEEGLNFSLGQRQLMALSRALVRNARIIVCDEATSSVDFETDEKIQRTMKDGFSGKTVLCIAHRLKTIIGYDRICVMDRGEVREMGAPIELWEQDGVFRGMCDKSGIAREDFFRE